MLSFYINPLVLPDSSGLSPGHFLQRLKRNKKRSQKKKILQRRIQTQFLLQQCAFKHLYARTSPPKIGLSG